VKPFFFVAFMSPCSLRNLRNLRINRISFLFFPEPKEKVNRRGVTPRILVVPVSLSSGQRVRAAIGNAIAPRRVGFAPPPGPPGPHATSASPAAAISSVARDEILPLRSQSPPGPRGSASRTVSPRSPDLLFPKENARKPEPARAHHVELSPGPRGSPDVRPIRSVLRS
jgi:hypothetical protein